MVTNIKEIDNEIASYTEKLIDVDTKELKRVLITSALKMCIAKDNAQETGIFLNDIYFPKNITFEFDSKYIAMYDGKNCIGLVRYEDVRTWS